MKRLIASTAVACFLLLVLGLIRTGPEAGSEVPTAIGSQGPVKEGDGLADPVPTTASFAKEEGRSTVAEPARKESSIAGGPAAVSNLDRLLQGASLIDESTRQVDSSHLIRIRVLETSGWPRLVRIVEELVGDEANGWGVVRVRAMAADHVLVQLDGQVDRIEADRFMAAAGLDLGQAVTGAGLFLVGFDGFTSAGQMDAVLEKLGKEMGGIEFAEPDYLIMATGIVPDDPRFGDQWALNSGEGGIDATTAWETDTSGAGAVVAVVDSGLRLTHRDLQPNLWSNPGEVPGNGIDDDLNGVVDDVHGYNAITESGDPSDDNGHGSHVAGIIGAGGNNEFGVSGVAWNVPLMAVKFLSSEGTGLTSDAVESLDYAREMGAAIINASWGSAGESSALSQAVGRLEKARVILVAAAGNEGQNLNSHPVYPASLSFANVITVAATDGSGGFWSPSNYGPGVVDIAAPGVGILSSVNGSDEAIEYLSGTSMAAPHVSGSLALLMGGAIRFDPDRAVARLRQAAVRDARLEAKVTGGLRLRLGKNFSSTLRPPENDDLADAFDLWGDLYAWTGSTIDSGLEAGEPPPPASLFTRSIWFSLRAEPGDRVSIKVRSKDDLVAASVFSGLPDRGTRPLATATGVIVGQEVSLLFDAPGQSITLAVYGTTRSSAEVSVRAAIVPPNDSFEDAIELKVIPFEVVVRTQGGGREPGEPDHGPAADGRSVWYRVKAPRSGVFHLSSDLGTLTPVVSVYQGSRLDALTRVATNNPGGFEEPSDTVLFEVTAGQDYWIAVDRIIDPGATVVLSGEYGRTPTVVAGPEDLRIEEGDTISLSVRVDGTPPFRYQWFKNGKALSNATRADLEIPGARPEDTGQYRVTVSNLIGSVDSRSAVVEVGHIYPITRAAATSRQVAPGGKIILSMAYGGAEPLSFQWFKDGIAVPGATAPTLTLESAGAGDAGRYVLRVSNSYGSYDSEPIRLVVADGSMASWTVRYPEARLIGMNTFADMGDEVWALGDGKIQVWHDDSGWETRDLGHDFDATDGLRVGDRYLLSGSPGAILESGDGYSWTYTNLETDNDGLQLAAGNGRMLAMGRNAGLWVSEGSGQWIRTDLNFESNTFPDLVFFQGQFFLATRSGIHGTVRLSRSTDGVAWTEVTTVSGGSDGSPHFLIAGDRLVFSVPERVFLATSDGLTWTEVGEPSLVFLTEYVDGVFYGRMAQWWSGLRSSTDLIDWQDSPVDPNRRIEFVHWRNGRFFLGFASEYGSDAIVTTRALDLETMGGPQSFDREGVVSLGGLSWLNGEFQAGKLRSGDGVTWRVPQAHEQLDAEMSYGNGFYVAPGSSSTGRHPATLKVDFRLYEAMSGDGDYARAAYGFGVHAVIIRGSVHFSQDGEYWSGLTFDEGARWADFKFLNGHFMAVGQAGMVALGRSLDDWTTVSTSFPQDLVGLTWGVGRYVVATGSETVLVSTNATTWQAMVIETGCAIWDVAFGDGRFVAVGDGCAFESTDGVFWTRNDPAETDLAFREVEFGAGAFVALTSVGEICQLGDPVGLAPVADLIRGPVPYPVAPLDHLEAEVDVVDPSGSEVQTRVFDRGIEIANASVGQTVVDLQTRSPGGHEVVIEATNSSGLKSSQAFRYSVNDYPGVSAIGGSPAIATMSEFKGQIYRAGEFGSVQRAAGDGVWVDLPPVPDRHLVIQLFSTVSWLYAVTQDLGDRSLYRSRDGLGWERVVTDPGRLERAGSLIYMRRSGLSSVLADDGTFHLAGVGTTKIVAFAGQFVAGNDSNFFPDPSARLWVSPDGMNFEPLAASSGGYWQGPFMADGQLVVRDANDTGLLLTTDLVHWENVPIPGSVPAKGQLFQAGSGLVILDGDDAWYSRDARTWTKFADQGYGGAVAVAGADLVIAGNRVLVFRAGRDPVLLGELPRPLSRPRDHWTTVEGVDGFVWITAESDPNSWGGDGGAFRFRVDPELRSLEIITEPRRGYLRKAFLGASQSAFLISRPDGGSFLVGRDPSTAVSSEAPEVINHELIASDGTAWVLAGDGLDTARSSDGVSWESGELVEGYLSISGWSAFYGHAPSWLAYLEPSRQFLAGWSPGFSEPGWWKSPDGLTWTYQAVENWYKNIGGIVSNGQVLVGLYYDSEIAVCSDGSTWSRIDPGFSGPMSDMRLLAPDVFAVHEGSSGRIFTSKDGLTWTRADNPETGKALNGVMVVSDDRPRILSEGLIWVSFDRGISWEVERVVDFAPSDARYLYHLDGNTFSEDLLSISSLEDLSLEIPDSAEIVGGRGRQVSVPLKITNNATSGSLTGTFRLDWNLTREAVWNPTEGGGLQRTSVTIDGLAAGATVEPVLDLILPDSLEAGHYHFTAWLDSEATLFEINETNNYASTRTPSVRVPAWTLEVAAEAGGEVVLYPSRLRYTDGERVAVIPRAKKGYAFVGWADGGSGGITVLNLTMDRNRNLTARFEPRYELSLRTVGDGSIAVDPEQPGYAPGTDITVTATAGDHWRFAGWEDDAVGHDRSASLSMLADRLATAVFEQNYALFRTEAFTDEQNLDPLVSGSDADADGDGFSNLAEFLLGADPDRADDRPDVIPVVLGQSVSLIYTRRIGVVGHRLSARWSTDLVNWSTEGVTESVLQSDSSIEIVESKLPMEPDTSVFFQLMAKETGDVQ